MGLLREAVSEPKARPLRWERAPPPSRANTGLSRSFILTRADPVPPPQPRGLREPDQRAKSRRHREEGEPRGGTVTAAGASGITPPRCSPRGPPIADARPRER